MHVYTTIANKVAENNNVYTLYRLNTFVHMHLHILYRYTCTCVVRCY